MPNISGIQMTPPAPLRVGRPLPQFALPDASDADGMTRSLRDYRLRQPVLLAFLHALECTQCRNWLATLAEHTAAFDEARAALLVIAPEPVDRLRALRDVLTLPFALLADAGGQVASQYLPSTPVKHAPLCVALALADRYGYCLAAWSAPDANTLPPLDQALKEFALADQDDCACGLPAWDDD